MMIAFPPCTHVAVSGARWFQDKGLGALVESLQLFDAALRLAEWTRAPYLIENPVSTVSTYWRKPDQIIQPWQFGHGETKATCLWLKNLPLLKPTNIVSGREGRVWKMGPVPTRARDRAETYQGIADAMAEQWGSL